MQSISMLRKVKRGRDVRGIVLGGMSGEISRGNVQGEMSGGTCARVIRDNRVLSM